MVNFSALCGKITTQHVDIVGSIHCAINECDVSNSIICRASPNHYVAAAVFDCSSEILLVEFSVRSSPYEFLPI
jgi:hypothetical protein